MGSFVTYKFAKPTGERVDSELQEFIKNYEYITNNYNGDVDKSEMLDTALQAILQTVPKEDTA